MNEQDILIEIKNDPTNASLWQQYATLAAQKQDWKTCVSAYLATLRLNPQPEVFQQSLAAYQNYINTLTNDFHFRFLRLPRKTLVMDMYGLMNMDVTEFENKAKSLLGNKYQVIFLHFAFVRNLTGLGPSTIKKIIKWSKEKGIDIAAVGVHCELRTTFHLKKIEVQEYGDLLQAFQNKQGINMNSLHLLFSTRYQEIRRQVATAMESRFRTYTVTICAVLFWVGLFSFFLRGFYFFSSYIPNSFYTIIIDYIFSIFYFSLFTMLMFSSLLIAVSLFFKNNETKFLMTKPIPHEDIFLYKLSETFIFASWAVFFLGIPVALAYGIQQGVNLWFYPLVIISFVPYIIIPCTLGALLSFIIVLYIAKFKKILGVVFAIVLAIGIAFLVYSIASEKENAPSYSAVWLFNILAYFQFTKWAFSPSLWMSQCMLSVAHLEFAEFFFYFLLLLSTSLALLFFSYWFAVSNYSVAWSKVYSDLSSKKLWKLSILRRMLNVLVFVSRRAKLFLEKDLKIFIRDPVQWSQFAILLGLLLLYILNLRTLKYDQKSTFWREIIANLNLMAISLTACTFASRFIFPMLSLEGKRFWTLGVMPIKRWSIIAAKFIFAMVILTLMTQTLVLLSAIMLKFPWTLMAYHAFIALLLTSGIAGLAVGLGAIYPNFREDSPSKIVSGFGGTLNLVVSLVYVFVIIFAQILPSHWLLESKISLSFYTLTLVTVLISVAVTLLPLGVGIRKFNNIEIQFISCRNCKCSCDIDI